MRLSKVLFVYTIPILCSLVPAHMDGQTHPEIRLESKSTGVGYALCGSCTVPQDISSAVLLVTKEEPGDPIELSGIIYKKDGVTPYSGVTLFLYQADAGGYYHRPQEDVFHPRIYGWLKTGKDGRYLIRTVKPAPEVLTPQGPAHIHVHIFGNGMPEHFLHEFWFQGDPGISPQDAKQFGGLGHFSPLITLKKGDDGIGRGTRDVRVRPAPPWMYEKD